MTELSKKKRSARLLTLPNRRQFIMGASGLVLSTASSGETIASGAVRYDVPDDPRKVFGRPANEDGGYGVRSQFAKGHRIGGNSWAMTPIQHLYGTITPSGLHYCIHHAGIPTIDPERHRLYIHGMVQHERELSMEHILRLPRVTRTHFLECAGNTFFEWKGPQYNDIQMTHGQMSNTEWTGVTLKLVLEKVGVDPRATWVIAEGADAAVMSRSIPLSKCMDDALLAFGQNGEELRPEQGFPIRLLLPGFEGNTNIKWLRRFQLTDKPHMTRMETRGYTDLLANGKARQFSFVMEAKSVITFPSAPMILDGPGFYEISGLAWSGRGRIRNVQVSADAGNHWVEAVLEGPVRSKAFVRFRVPWQWDGKPAVLQSRCIDETGYVQPSLKQLVKVRGLNSVDHNNAVQQWAINANGEVSNVQV
jgi:sulfane dehydrogenase subunit SoxC